MVRNIPAAVFTALLIISGAALFTLIYVQNRQTFQSFESFIAIGRYNTPPAPVPTPKEETDVTKPKWTGNYDLKVYKKGSGMISLDVKEQIENTGPKINVQCIPLENGMRPAAIQQDKLINYNAGNVLKATDVHTVSEYALVDYTKQKVNFRMPYVQPETQARACDHTMTKFFFLCNGKVPEHFSDEPTIWNWLWHNETTPMLLQYADCAYLDSASGHGDVISSVYTEKGMLHHPGYLKLSPNEKVDEYEELVTAGQNHYPDAFGHWPQEILPKLIWLWFFAPKGIPLVWPIEMIKIYNHFTDRGILNPKDRRVIFVKKKQTLFAKRIWLLNSSEVQGYTIENYVEWRHMQRLFLHYFREEKPKETILIINRNKSAGSRHFTNMEELIQRIKDKYSDRYIVEEFIKEPTFLDVGRVFYHARVVIGAHGAGLANQLFMRPGTSTIEVGPLSSDMTLPSMYFGLAKGLGIHYSLSVCEGNIYAGKLTPNLDEIMRALEFTITKMIEEGSWKDPQPH